MPCIPFSLAQSSNSIYILTCRQEGGKHHPLHDDTSKIFGHPHVVVVVVLEIWVFGDCLSILSTRAYDGLGINLQIEESKTHVLKTSLPKALKVCVYFKERSPNEHRKFL